MEQEYIKIPKTSPFPKDTDLLRIIDDSIWKTWVFRHLLSFYKNYDREKLNAIIKLEQSKPYPRTERAIAKFLRKHLIDDKEFSLNFKKPLGELTNDEDVEGNYDIVIENTYWENRFYFECKNLREDKPTLINEYVYCKKVKDEVHYFDGGVYRYFNGKYAQNQDFGGMIGFVLQGDAQPIKDKIIKKLEDKFDISPKGDLQEIKYNSIENNDFTFNSIHQREGNYFTLHHLLFQFH
ncbi:MAG: hypothetical protein LBN27_05375 [Prevotellaceae bacterium]|jgi:hypothetical protein|nr:hypothetical protein [Prevotellaceae bacterium]